MKLCDTIIRAATVFFLAQSLAHAELVTYQFKAKLLLIDDYSQVFGDTSNIGDTFSGTYTIDTSTPNTSGAPYFKMYHPMSPAAGFTIDLGSTTIDTRNTGACTGLQIYNDYYFDAYNIWSDVYCNGTTYTNDFILPDWISLDMMDSNGTGVDNVTDITSSPPPLDLFQDRFVSFGNSNYWVQAELISIEPFKETKSSESIFISPNSGMFLSNQHFDVAVGVYGDLAGSTVYPFPTYSLVEPELSMTINGYTFTNYDMQWMCFPNGPTKTSKNRPLDHTWLCPVMYYYLIPGQSNTIDLVISEPNGDVHSSSLKWDLLP